MPAVRSDAVMAAGAARRARFNGFASGMRCVRCERSRAPPEAAQFCARDDSLDQMVAVARLEREFRRRSVAYAGEQWLQPLRIGGFEPVAPRHDVAFTQSVACSVDDDKLIAV